MRSPRKAKWIARIVASFRSAELLSGQVRFHASSFAWLITLAVAMLSLAWLQLSYRELLSAAITLPVLWSVSVLFRLSAQQFALSRDASETIWLIGPTGNLSLDYEYLPRRRLLAYALAGQVAGMALLAVGWLAQMATSPDLTAFSFQVDFRGGFNNHALATQLFWVNAFLCGLHLLPTVPFDMRALLYGLMRGTEAVPVDPFVLRSLSSFVSHLSAVALGAGVTAMGLSAWRVVELPWYALLGCTVYLFVVARWEGARANELEQQYAPLGRPKQPGAARPGLATRSADRNVRNGDSVSAELEWEADSVPKPWCPDPSHLNDADESDAAISNTRPTFDIDEILRKLHREGQSSLTDDEREFLISASKQLNEKRSQD